MSNIIYNKFKIFLLAYLLYITISSFIFLGDTYLLETNNSMAEWVINYKGGFGRRGFLGELFANLSLLTKIHLKTVILFFLFFLILTYHIVVFNFLKDINFNIYFILIILSPLFVIFPVAELEALGRKDILIPFSFLIFCFFYEKAKIWLLFLILLLIYTVLILTHEVSIFYLPFFYLIIFFKIKHFNIYNILMFVLISFYFLLLIFFLIKFNHTDQSIYKMCEILKNEFNTICGLGAYVLNRTLSENIAELFPMHFYDIIRGLWIYLIGSVGLIILLFNIEKDIFFKIHFFKYIKFNYIFFILFLFSIIPFFIAVDWGRWFNISYTMLIFFFIFCYKNKILILKKEINIFSLKFFEKNLFLFSIMLFVLTFSWNPKAIHKDDIGSIPIYRITTKIFKILNN